VKTVVISMLTVPNVNIDSVLSNSVAKSAPRDRLWVRSVRTNQHST